MVRKISVKAGDVFKNNVGEFVDVVCVKNAADITIRYRDKFAHEAKVTMFQLKNGNFKNPYTPSVRGVGFVGVGNYSPKTHTEIYNAWQGIIQRCFDDKLKERYPKYKDVSLDNEWHNFQNFAKWYEEETKNRADDEVWQVDKDFSRAKLYGPKTCVVVPKILNFLIVSHDNKRGEYPIGVTYRQETGKYRSRCQVGSGVPATVGEFETVEEAFQAYKVFKENRIKTVIEDYKQQLSERALDILRNYRISEKD